MRDLEYEHKTETFISLQCLVLSCDPWYLGRLGSGITAGPVIALLGLALSSASSILTTRSNPTKGLPSPMDNEIHQKQSGLSQIPRFKIQDRLVFSIRRQARGRSLHQEARWRWTLWGAKTAWQCQIHGARDPMRWLVAPECTDHIVFCLVIVHWALG